MRAAKIFISEFVRWAYWYPARWVVQRLPLSLSYRVMELASYPACLVLRRKRSLIERGLAALLGEQRSARERRAVARRTFENTFKKAAEVLWYPKLTADVCQQIFRYEGLEHLDSALKEGRGVILLHGHIANPDMLMPAMGHKGYKVHQLISRLRPPRLNRPLMAFPNWVRGRAFDIKLAHKLTLPVNMLYSDRSPRQLIQVLKNNEVLLAAIDGREGSQWIEVDFLNRRALFRTGIMNLVRSMRPVVLPVFVVREAHDKQAIVIHPPMDFQFTEDKERDLRENTRTYLARLEQFVVQYPWLYANVYWLGDAFFVDERSNVSDTVMSSAQNNTSEYRETIGEKQHDRL